MGTKTATRAVAKAATKKKDAEAITRYFIEELEKHFDHAEHLSEDSPHSSSELFWDPDTRTLSQQAWRHQVELHLPFAWGEGIHLRCDCYFVSSPHKQHSHCSNTQQLAARVHGLLQKPAKSSIARAIRNLPLAPAWNWTFRLLDGLLTQQDRLDAEAKALTKAEPRRRLTWRVAFGDFFAVGAWEQRISKSTGKWTAGRRINWDKLHDSPELLTHEGDRRAAAAIHEETGYYHIHWTIDSFAALMALAGHPDVFLWDEPKRHVTIEESQLGLAVDSREDGLTPDGSLGGHPLREFSSGHLVQRPRGLVGFLEAENRVLFTQADPAIVAILVELRNHADGVPTELQDELLKRLDGFESRLPVALSPDLESESQKADPNLFLRLTPAEPSGLVARLLARPTPRSPYSLPGEGSPRLLSLQQGQRVVIERSLSAETNHAQQLAQTLGLDKQRREQRWQWRVENDDDALDLVLAAREQVEQGGLVVEWPEGGRRKVASAASPAALKVRIRDRHDWFGVEGTVEGDGWKLPILAILQAWRQGRRYVSVGDGTWALIARELRERLTALDDVAHVRQRHLEVDATAAPVLRGLTSDAGTLSASRRFRKLLHRLKGAEGLTPDPPEELTAELRDYQLEGYRWLRRLSTWGVGGCLADDMGLGKTVQTLAVLIDRQKAGPTLVIAPTSVGFNWLREAERFAPTLNFAHYRETDRDTVFNELKAGDVLVATYGLLRRDAEKLTSVPWGTLILDEAQAIKNSRTKTARAVRSLRAEWRLALTGTPVENHLGELWSLFQALSPGLFGSWQSFSTRFAKPIEIDHDSERRQALSRVLRPFVLRRTKSEVLSELPERTEIQLTVELGPLEQRLYDDTRLKLLAELAKTSSAAKKPAAAKKRKKRGPNDQRFQVLAALTRLRQLACHPALVDSDWATGSAKLRLLIETIEELREGRHRALVFSQFTRHLALVRQALDERGIRYQYLDGQTPAAKREELIDEFQDGDGDVFLISLKAGGTGLNLTAADYVIHLDPWWNPAVEDQATDRAHRIGQTRPVTVYRLVTRGTIEEEILRLHADKRDLMAGVLAGTDKAGKLSTAELVELIRSG